MFLLSRLIQPRGLKSPTNDANCWPVFVEAYTASWIEIPIWRKGSHCGKSRLIQPRGLKCPLAYSKFFWPWSRLIQPRGLKYFVSLYSKKRKESRLIQPRGLKYSKHIEEQAVKGRGLYSLVDWNCFQPGTELLQCVEAYTASWIEITRFLFHWSNNIVEAYTASWIEIPAVLLV